MMIDPEKFEPIVQAIADRAAIDPVFRARLDAVAREARRWLAEVEAAGMRVHITHDGWVELERQLH